MTRANEAAERPLPGEPRSVWLDTTPATSFGELTGDVSADTVVVGGGIAGITTAYQLQAAGQSVVVLERGRVLEGVTGHTTAKLTAQHGLLYHHLRDRFGEERARQYADANQAAIDEVESTADALGVDCEFERTPAYAYVTAPEDASRVREEADAAARLGLPATYTESTPLPFDVAAAVRFDDQARFHPRAYLLALAREIPGDGSHVFERTRAVDVEDGEPCRVVTDRGTVTADSVVVATHFPFVDRAFYFARLYPKRSYVLAVRLRNEAPEGMYYRPGDPYFSVRPQTTDESLVLVGGQNHRTGRGGSAADRYRRLEREARDRFDVASVEYRWSTQDYASVDRVPFVGEHSPRTEYCYVATGFGGWGLTNGIVAGSLLSDLVRGRENPWRAVYRPTRLELDASWRALFRHAADAAGRSVMDRLRRLPALDDRPIEPGEGVVVEVDDEAVGVCRDETGEVHAVSARCTHMGCLVEWNDAELSWDCPCHGSRFDHDGAVLDTPAVDDLDARHLDDLAEFRADSERPGDDSDGSGDDPGGSGDDPGG